jgi:AcrR family transcriptional regulator
MARMSSSRGKYTTRTEDAIRGAFLRVLAHKPLSQMTVAEVAREAKVSRSTFYEHYRNLSEVYESLVAEFNCSTSPLLAQVDCTGCDAAAVGEPLCVRLREPGEFKPVIDDDRFLATFLDSGVTLSGHDLFGLLTSAGYTADQANAICRFQLSGCFSVARQAGPDDAQWDETRELIDTFIRGGIQACLERKERENLSRRS